MAKIKAVLGIMIAFLGLPLILATFVGEETWIDMIASTGIKMSPWESGGEVAFSILYDQYRTDVHRPVFDTLVGQRDQGFVQVDWAPPENLPEVIDEVIDYDFDGIPDFHIHWITEEGERAQMTPLQPLVLGLQVDVQIERAYVVRVDLKNPNYGK